METPKTSEGCKRAHPVHIDRSVAQVKGSRGYIPDEAAQVKRLRSGKPPPHQVQRHGPTEPQDVHQPVVDVAPVRAHQPNGARRSLSPLKLQQVQYISN
eukprot:166752-Prorocentrum_minimum.AAC.1